MNELWTFVNMIICNLTLVALSDVQYTQSQFYMHKCAV